MKLTNLIALPVISIAAIACSSVKKADVAATANPSEEIAALDQKVEEGYKGHFDVLAADDFSKTQTWLKEAKEDLRDGESQSEILGDIGYAQSYYKRASERSATRQAQIPSIIESRQKAIDAGARNFPPTQKELAKLDAEIRSDADRLAKLDSDEVADLQGNYLKLELNSIKNTQLGKAAGMIQGAKDKKAGDYAPQALKRAELDYANAENLINANRNGTDSYAAAVSKATNTADLLVAITAATKAGKVDENTASKIVMQERQIASLEGQVNAADMEAQQMNSAMAQQGQKLQAAGAAISLQQSLENARKEFSAEEAEVFQQGDKLLIRLKSMNFPSGRSDLPASALPILAKVKGVADGLAAKEVVVEGHTDSTGSAKVNSALSEKRADAIAKYLETNGIEESKIESVGYGFKKPIASNKSKEGRAQNRRVDIIITPEGTKKSQQM